MTEGEAREVLAVMTTADGSCRTCAVDLIKQFLKAFPQYRQAARDAFFKEFEADLEEAIRKSEEE